jgi:hypothetical protein
VKKSLVGILGLVGLAAVLATNGCGDSGESGGTYSSAIESCSAYCETYFAACAPPQYTTHGQCKITLCSPIPSMASAACYAATKTWYDCRKAEADLCGDTGCTAQATAALDACP